MAEHEPVTILLVDDDPAKLLSCEAALRELGEPLLTARSGREALDHLLHQEIGVILLDVSMPEIDGFELAQLIRAHPRYQQTALIFISARYLTHLDQLQGYEHGAVDYITVPFLPELLRAKVRAFANLYRAAKQLARAEREMQRAQHFAMLGHLAAGLAHEIRNPLAAVFLHVDLLAEELSQFSVESPARVAESMADLQTELTRLRDLVADYLVLVGSPALERTAQDFGAALRTWVRAWQSLATAQGVTLHVDGLSDVGRVVFHPDAVSRALRNLVRNAVEAMPQGGTLRVRAQRTATHVQMQDTGRGIPPTHLARIFEPLYTTKPGGSGLGLYLVQEIMAAHGGQVTVESVVGQGTTFTVTFPLPEDTPA